MNCPKTREWLGNEMVNNRISQQYKENLIAELDDMEAELQQEIELRCLAGKLRNTVEKRYFELEAENERLKSLLGFENGYSNIECLRVLAEANKHQREVHNCDVHGYETFYHAEVQALKYVELYDKGDK